MSNSKETRLACIAYRSIARELEESRFELVDTRNEKIDAALTKLENTFAMIKNIAAFREAALDSNLISIFSSLGKERAKNILTSQRTKEFIDFVAALQVILRCENPNELEGKWSLIGELGCRAFKFAPTWTSVTGGFSENELPSKSAVKRCMTKSSSQQKPVPTKLIELNAINSKCEETSKQVQKILDCLRDIYRKHHQAPVLLYEFALDPKSFSKTVENFFHISFILKDKYATLEFDDNGVPHLAPCSDKDDVPMERQQHKLIDDHVMLTLTYEEWETAVKLFRVETAMIPDD